MKKIFYAFRSTIAGLIIIPSTLVNCVMVVLSMPLGHKVQYKFARAWSHIGHYTLRFVTGLQYEIVGQENLPDTASVVFMKHHSAWETMTIFRIVPQFVIVLKRELMSIPIFGHALKSIKMIDIDRSKGSSAVLQVIEKGKDRLRDGLWVAIFPEGTRMVYGRTRRFGKSGALLAKEAGVPLVVIAHNAGEFWGKKTLMVTPGKIKVIIGKPIMPEGKSADEMLLEASSWMETTMRENFPAYKKLAKNFDQLQLADDGGNFQVHKKS